MKKLLNIFSWFAGFSLMALLLAFSSNCREELRLTDLAVEIDFESGQYFVTEEEVSAILREEYPYWDSLYCKEININLLEERLDSHPSIRKAEVYSALDGVLRVSVTQKRPSYRVQQSKGSYYVDEEGDSMALSDNYSARVPLVTGAVGAQNRRAIFEFWQSLEEDPAFRDFFSGLQVESDSSWVLFPEPGRHRVLLGQPSDLKEKMHKLRIFYEKAVTTKNLDSITSLNLAFAKQVVCTKI